MHADTRKLEDLGQSLWIATSTTKRTSESSLCATSATRSHREQRPRRPDPRLHDDQLGRRIRMDPSPPCAMQCLQGMNNRFDIAFACDTDRGRYRHGISTPKTGLMPPNHYLSVAIDYLFRHRRGYGARTLRSTPGIRGSRWESDTDSAGWLQCLHLHGRSS